MDQEISMVDVLVVGAGPTGLMMAAQLERAGVTFRIVDRQKDRAQESRALVLHARSMELFQNLGLENEFLSKGKKSIGMGLYINSKEKLKINFGNISIEDTPFPFILFISQAETEKILIDHLKRRSAKIERETELVDFSQDSNEVHCTIRGRDGTEEKINCKYLIGCDGAHSKVRHGLGLEFEGAPYSANFILADVEIEWPYDRDRLLLFFSMRGLLAQFPLTDKITRLIISQPKPPADPDSQPTLDEVQKLIHELVEAPAKISNPVWLARFHLHHRGVNQYRVDRCFVAGDAAHIHSPVGGQGMNTGLQDAANVAWKLILVLKKVAPEKILDTYQEERYRIGQILLKTTDRLFSIAATRNPILAWIRNLLMPAVTNFFLSSASGRRKMFRFTSQLAIHYHSAWAREEILKEGFNGGPMVGCRAPDAPVGSISLFEKLKGEHLKILLFFPAVADLDQVFEDLQSNLRQFLKVHVFYHTRDFERLYRRYGIKKSGMYLLRPDGYVLFRCDTIDFDIIHDYIYKTFSFLSSEEDTR